MKHLFKSLTLGLSASALIFSGCGKPADEAASAQPEAPVEVKIPDAPDEAMKMVFTELSEGNGGILWKVMPASYQNDLNTIVQLAGTKIDADMYNKSFQLIDRIGNIIGKQQDFILNTSLAPTPEDQKAKLSEGIPMVVDLIRIIGTSDIATSAGLQSFDGQAFFDSTVSDLAKLVIELSKLDDSGEPSLEDLGDAEFEVVEVTDTTATLSMTAAGKTETEQLTKVEGRWVPVEMASTWATNMAEAKAKLESASPESVAASKPQVMQVLDVLDRVLDQIKAAETQAEFDQALQGAMMPLMGVYMMMQGGGNGGAPMMPMPSAP